MASEWAYALAQGAEAAALSASKSIGDSIKEEASARDEERKSALRLKELTALERIKEEAMIRAEERKRERAAKMGKEIDAKAEGLLNSPEAQGKRRLDDASSINAKLGSQIDPSNPESQEALDAIRKSPGAMTAYGLLGESRAEALQRRADAARSLGYLEANRDLNVEAASLRREASDKARGEREEKRLDEIERANRAREVRQDDVAKANAAYQKALAENGAARATEAAQRDRITATKEALKGAESELKEVRERMKDPLRDETLKKADNARIAALEREAGDYRKALASGGLPPASGPSGPPKFPAPPKAAVDSLISAKNDPAARKEFDEIFGPGAADKAIKGEVTRNAPISPAGGAKAAAKESAPPASAAPSGSPPEKPSKTYTGVNAGERDRIQLQIDRILWTANNTPNLATEQRAALASQLSELQSKLAALAK